MGSGKDGFSLSSSLGGRVWCSKWCSFALCSCSACPFSEVFPRVCVSSLRKLATHAPFPGAGRVETLSSSDSTSRLPFVMHCVLAVVAAVTSTLRSGWTRSAIGSWLTVPLGTAPGTWVSTARSATREAEACCVLLHAMWMPTLCLCAMTCQDRMRNRAAVHCMPRGTHLWGNRRGRLPLEVLFPLHYCRQQSLKGKAFCHRVCFVHVLPLLPSHPRSCALPGSILQGGVCSSPARPAPLGPPAP
jgi:hypothetical protein